MEQQPTDNQRDPSSEQLRFEVKPLPVPKDCADKQCNGFRKMVAKLWEMVKKSAPKDLNRLKEAELTRREEMAAREAAQIAKSLAEAQLIKAKARVVSARAVKSVAEALEQLNASVEKIRNAGGDVRFNMEQLMRLMGMECGHTAEVVALPSPPTPNEKIDNMGKQPTNSTATTDPYEELKETRNLPSPNAVTKEIMNVAADPRSSFRDIGVVVERDPATVARLLKYVNSPFAGVRRKISSVSDACTLLGTQTVIKIALGFSLLEDHKTGQCKVFDYEGYWSDSVGRATAARYLSSYNCREYTPDDAFTVGLLCQIGRLAFATAKPEQYAMLLARLASSKTQSLTELENATFGLDHNELASRMMLDWGVRPLFCNAVQAQDNLDNLSEEDEVPAERLLAFTLHWSGLVSSVLVGPNSHKCVLDRIENEARVMGITDDTIHDGFDIVSHEWTDLSTLLNVRTRRVPLWRTLCAEED